ncbi:MAG: glycosyltransferase [Nitrospira sp.]|nr:glycosyltransferase [Nitrospira sp.]
MDLTNHSDDDHACCIPSSQTDCAAPSLISVVVATFNADKTLGRCIDSVARQSYPHKELIVIDGGSSDGTVETLKANADKIAYWISEPDRGIYHAWNKALVQAHGDWICFLGADDYLWDSRVLEEMAPHLSQALSETRVVYGQVALVNESGTELDRFGKPWLEIRHSFMTGKALNIHQAMFHHRSLFKVRGKFDESFRIAGDYDLLLRELRDGQAVFVPCLVTAMQHGGISSNPASKMNTIREIMKAMRNNGLKPPMSLHAAWIRAVAHAWLYRIAGKGVSGGVADGYRSLTGKTRLWTSTGK